MNIKNTVKLISLATIITILTACNSSDSDTSSQDSVTYSDAHHVILEGEDNLRDLGGYAGADGKRIVSGKLFRSGELSSLTDDDQQVLVDLGIEQVIDLRSDYEIADKPDALPATITSYNYPLLSDDTTGATQTSMSPEDMEKMYMDALLSGDISKFMLPAYKIDEFKIQQWTKIFDLLEEGKSTLWHCTAGQDRAGMTTALVLETLGVDRNTIMTDYLKSNDYTYDDKFQSAQYLYLQAGSPADTSPEAITQSMLIKKEYLQAFYDDIDQNHGGIDNFLNEIGVDVNAMREHYLEK